MSYSKEIEDGNEWHEDRRRVINTANELHDINSEVESEINRISNDVIDQQPTLLVFLPSETYCIRHMPPEIV